MHQRLIPLAATEAWKTALKGIPHAFGHTWESCHAMWLTTAAPTYLYAWESSRGRGVCPFSERSFRGTTDIFTPYGFSGFAGVGDRSGMAAGWVALMQRQGYVCGFIALNPVLFEIGDFAPVELHEYNDLYVLELDRNEEALFASLSPNRKRQVRRADRGTPGLSTDQSACRRFLVERLPRFYQEKGASAVYRFSEATLQHLLDGPCAFMIGAERDGDIEAVCLFLYTAYVAEYFAGVSLPEARAHSAALLWHGALELKRRGVPLLNLGGGVSRGDGVADFKERFGGVKLPLRALRQVYRPEVYEDLCSAAGADPLDRSGFFPAYHRPGIVRSDAAPDSAHAHPVESTCS